jgi:hypothetical protein
MEHRVIQVLRVVGPEQVSAISGNPYPIRSTAGVIGWRDVTDVAITASPESLKNSI